MKKIFRSIFTAALALVFIVGAIGPTQAARYENLSVGNLTVERSAAIQGLLQAAANTTGKVFYVHSGTGINAIGRGTDSTKPFASVDFAINQTRANKGDFIVVMPGHAESFTAANGFDADVAGVTIIGLGSGADRPTFTFAGTAADVAIGAASVTVANVRFKAGISDIVRGISVEATGDDFTLVGCDFPVPGTATFEFLEAILLASGADNATFKYNTYRDGASSAANTWINADAGVVVNLRIIGNDVFGRFAVAPVHSTRADTGVLIQANAISNTITGQYAIEFTAAATGVIADNRLYTDTFATTLDPGSMMSFNNLIATTVDGGSRQFPADAVVGDITDTAATGAVTATDTLMAYQKQVVTNTEKIDGATLATSPTSGSLATFVASGGTALGTALATSKSLVDAIGTNGTTVADTATGIAGMIGVNDADNAMDTSTVVANANGSLFERNEALQVVAAPSKSHPNYFTVTADMTSATWNTAAAHEIATVTGAVRMQIMVEVTATIVTTGTNGTIALGYEGNASAIFSATALDAALTGDVFSAVYGSAATSPASGADAQSALTHALFDVVIVNGMDAGYTIGTNAATTGTLTFHVWWTPLSATGAVVAGAGGVL